MPAARGLAIVALGLGAHYGLPSSTRAIEKLLKDRTAKDRSEIATAAMLHYQLNPSPRLGNLFHKLHSDKSEPMGVRARAAELIPRISNDPKASLEALQYYLNCRYLELRRSAAMALGQLKHPLVLPRIMTAYELEEEPVTRGFILLAIARQGGDIARDFLIKEAHKGKDKPLRAWAALALGDLAGREDDKVARDALRKTKLQKADQGALWLTLGISHDTASVPRLVAGLSRGRNPWTRSHAATALAMIGAEEGLTALRERCAKEKSEFVLGFLANAISTFGQPQDVDRLVTTLQESNNPQLQSLMAVSLGYHGSEAALDGVFATLQSTSTASASRGAALESLGLLLDRRPGLAMPVTYRRSNFGVLPGWALPAIRTSL